MEIDKYSNAFFEVYEIIMNLEYGLKEKIPQSFIDFILQNKSINSSFQYNKNITINEQNISEEAKIILSIIYKDYLATEEEKQEIVNAWKKNEENFQEELNVKYNIDDIFDNKNKVNKLKEQKSIMIVKDEKNNILHKIIRKIKALFRI